MTKKGKMMSHFIDMSDHFLEKAKEYIKSGGKVEAIKAKYKLTKEQEQELATL